MMDAMEVAAALRRAAENAGCGTHAVVSGSGYCPDGSCGECLERSRAWFAEAADAIERCALPDGVKWPRFEDREPVKLGDTASFIGDFTVDAIEFSRDNDGGWHVRVKDGADNDWSTSLDATCERVKRPAVLAADGEPLEVGQTVYGTRDLEPVEIVSLRSKEYDGVRSVKCKDRTGFVFYAPDDLIHQRPVLDADGVPIKVGDTVYFTDGREQKSNTVVHAKYDYKDEPYVQLGRLNEVGYPTYTNCSCIDPLQLTHTKPEVDSWERIEADCSKTDVEYCDEHGLLDLSCNTDEGEAAERHCTDCGCTCGEKMARDLVRRCRALAERGE